MTNPVAVRDEWKKVPAPSYTIATTRHAVETHQLEAHLGRLPLFFKSSDGIAYTVPVQPIKPGYLPVVLQAVKMVQLFFSRLYPLKPCRIEVKGLNREAALCTEKGFERKVKEKPECGSARTGDVCTLQVG